MTNINKFMEKLYKENTSAYFSIIALCERYGYDYNADLQVTGVVEEEPAVVAEPDCPPVVEKFDKDVYVAWARHLGLYMEEYSKVRKADRQKVYDHMYGKVQ